MDVQFIYTVIRFLWVSAKFGTCTVVSVNGTQVEDKMRTFNGQCEQFIFNRCPIYIHDGASAKFSTNSQETDNSVMYIIYVLLQINHYPHKLRSNKIYDKQRFFMKL